MNPTWKQADLFPVIARVIEQASEELQRFVTHREIVERLLQDPEGRNLVVAAQDEREDEQPLESIAGNMVAWFSMRITTDNPDWARAFERTKIEGDYAYKWVNQFGQQG